MNKEENLFYKYSIDQIHSLIEQRELDYRDIINECVAKTREIDSEFHVWASFDEQVLRDQVDEVYPKQKNRESLAYIPIGVKDIFNTRLFPTQMGSALWKNFTPGNDARIVHNLSEAGAVIAGKTVTAEFAVHALNETLNPHDITRTPGTSSSGSAAAISLGIVPVAFGTQTAASIIRPASFCGIYGFKPSFGLIPRTGMLKTTDSLDAIGYFTIHYKDLRKVFDAVRVQGRNYPLSDQALSNPERQNKPKSRPWRVAFIKTYTWDKAEDYAQKNILEFIEKLGKLKDVEVSEFKLPSEFSNSHDVHSTIYDKTLSYYFQHEYKKQEQISGIMKELINRGQFVKLEDYKLAIESQNNLCVQMDQIMQDYDVLISLTTAGAAPLREVMETPDPSLIWSLLHLPVVSAPAFQTENNLPFGVQFGARKYNDYLLFNFLDYLLQNGLIPEKNNPMLSFVRT